MIDENVRIVLRGIAGSSGPPFAFRGGGADLSGLDAAAADSNDPRQTYTMIPDSRKKEIADSAVAALYSAGGIAAGGLK